MTKREQKIECMRVMEDGMIWLTMGDTGRMSKPLRDFLYALGKAAYILLEESVKRGQNNH